MVNEFNPMTKKSASEFLEKLSNLLAEYDVDFCVEGELIGYTDFDCWLVISDPCGNGINMGKGFDASGCSIDKATELTGSVK